MKEIVAREVASFAKDGDVIGVGTGSTVDAAIDALAQRVKNEGLSLSDVPTSYQSAWRLEEAGLNVVYAGYRGVISWGFDGADQVTSAGVAIKGKGGAMLKEKILAVRCARYFIVVDQSKLVSKLGVNCPVPIEVIPEAVSFVQLALPKLGANSALIRQAVAKHGPVITEAGNLIIDAQFNEVTAALESKLKSLVGVVESGIFSAYADAILVGSAAGVQKIDCKRAQFNS